MPQDKKPQIKALVTPELRRLWINIRKAWGISVPAFSSTLSSLNPQQSQSLYDLVKLGLFKGSVAEIVRTQPGLKAIILSEEDRICMYQIYENLSWRLGKKEPEPSDVKMVAGLKGGIGRASPFIEI